MIVGVLGAIGRLIGVSCYNQKGKFSFVSTFWSAAFTLFVAGLMILAEYQMIDFENENSPARKALVIVLILTDMMISFAHFIMQITKRAMFEELFLLTRKTKNHIYDYYITTAGLVIFIAMVLDPWDAVILLNPTFWTQYRHDFVKFYHFVVFVILLQFCSLVSRVSVRLRLTRLLLEKIEVAIHHHAKLTYLAKNANQMWNVQLLLICFHIFGYVVLLIYDAVRPLIDDPDKDRSITDYFNIALPLLLTIIQLCCLANTCHQTTNNADSFNEELFKLLEDHPIYAKDEKLNMYLTFNETVHFSACGFFGLGYPMITAITATTASYLVILLQSM